MTSKSIRRLFVAVLIFLPAQYGLVGLLGDFHYGEPWPAVVLPGFKTVYATSGDIEVDHTTFEVLFANGETVSVSPSDVLAPLPRSHHVTFLNEQCRPARLSGSYRTERCLAPAGVGWFVSRAASLFPQRSVRRVDVIWSRLRVDPPMSTPTFMPLDTLHLTP